MKLSVLTVGGGAYAVAPSAALMRDVALTLDTALGQQRGGGGWRAAGEVDGDGGSGAPPASR